MEDVTPLAAAVMGVFSEMERFLEEEPGVCGPGSGVGLLFLPERLFICLRAFGRALPDLRGSFRDGFLSGAAVLRESSEESSECMDQGVSTILYSATLLPVRYYKTLLSGQEGDYAVYANSIRVPEEKTSFDGGGGRQQPLYKEKRGVGVPEGGGVYPGHDRRQQGNYMVILSFLSVYGAGGGLF